MIIKDTATLRKYLSVNGSVEYDNLAPYLKKAERTFLKPIIGVLQLAEFEVSEPLADPIINQALELAQEAVANYGYYLYAPIGVLQVTDSGFHVVSNENTQPASDKQFKELQRSFLTSAHEALDELLAHMELSADKFQQWFESDYYTVYKDLLVNKTSVFNKYYHIFNSRQTFVAIRPNIIVVEDQFIKPVVGVALLTALKENQTHEIRKQVKQLLQQSIVAFSIMKTVDNGMFILDAKGMHMRFDVLPYEKKMGVNTSGNNDFIDRTKQNKRNEGEEYLKMALDVIDQHQSTFPEYTKKEAQDHISITDTKSIVGL
jgi:hypothetical protein